MSAPVLLVILATGSAVALSDLSARVMGFSRPPPPAASAGEPDWARALTAAQTRFPGAELRMASWPASAGKPLVVRLRQPAEWHTNGRTIVYVDPATSAVLGVEDAVANQASRRLFDTFWPVHASKVGGWLWKVVTFLAGIALAALAIYGAESYRRKIFPKRARRSAAPAAL